MLPAVFSISSSAVTDIDFSLDQGGSIAGQVTEDGPLMGLGLSSFLVYALDATTGDFAGSATTDFSGNYTVTGMPAGNYIIYVNSGIGLSILSGGHPNRFAGEYYPNTYDRAMAGQVTVTAGGSVTMVDVALGGGGSVSGAVTQASDSMPMSFVPVFLSPYVQSETDFLYQITFFQASPTAQALTPSRASRRATTWRVRDSHRRWPTSFTACPTPTSATWRPWSR